MLFFICIIVSDSKKSINDVKFAPRHHGLKFASASADGKLRIYEATDCFVLSHWNLQVDSSMPLLSS